jgi:hydroxymethylpyrimidine/phosphomethylpyrimidine kinase
VLLKGGHLPGDPVDVLAGPEDVRQWRAARVAGPPIHGTGCTLSALIAGYLALGHTVADAVEQARARLQQAIARAWSPAAEGWRYLGGLDANG